MIQTVQNIYGSFADQFISKNSGLIHLNSILFKNELISLIAELIQWMDPGLLVWSIILGPNSKRNILDLVFNLCAGQF